MMRVVCFFVGVLFCCRHKRTSRVFSDKQEAWQVCFDCGRRLRYDWQEMKRIA